MQSEPYRKLFFLAFVLGVLGVALWPLHSADFISYPLASHQQTMILGMFLSFVSGFLMTALPKMSGTSPASEGEKYFAVALILFSSLLSLMGYPSLAAITSAVQFVHLFIFAGRRVLDRQKNPPVGFLFVPMGLLWGFSGSILKALQWQGIDLGAYGSAIMPVALEQAFLLNLVVGLGSRLIPFLTRSVQVSPMEADRGGLSLVWIHALILNLSFIFEPLLPNTITYAVRSLVLISASLFLFKIYRPVNEFTVLGWGIKISIAALIVGTSGLAIFPEKRLLLLHILFISGFALLTFMIATRVVLAHGGHSTNFEKTSKQLVAIILMLAIAAGFRTAYLLNFAAAAWIIALLIWFNCIGRLLFQKAKL